VTPVVINLSIDSVLAIRWFTVLSKNHVKPTATAETKLFPSIAFKNGLQYDPIFETMNNTEQKKG
jgi:hypothetical protein